MVKNVIELLDEIAKGNLNKLPKKIMIENTILEKDEQFETYFTKDYGIGLMSFLSGTNTLIEYLKFPVKEVKERNWRPKKGEYYWCVTSSGDVDDYLWECINTDSFLYNTENCFKTKEEAQNHLDNIKTEIELRKLAEKLNADVDINWKNEEQTKYYLSYDYEDDEIYCQATETDKYAKNIYCLDDFFKQEAIKKIGEEELKKYLMEE